MQFTTLALSALISSVFAQDIRTHVVRVGSMDPAAPLTFSPSELVAAPGDVVQFQFAPKNHTVTQSTFDKPCEPSLLNSNITGINSGFMPIPAGSEMTATYTIRINSTAPMWLYCAQGKHCQNGMVMVINAPAAKPERNLAAYKAAAANAPANIPGDAVVGLPTTPGNGTATQPSGGSGSYPSSAPGGGSGSGSGNGNAGGNSGSDSGTPTTSAGTPDNTGAASTLSASSALGLSAALALAFTIFM